MRNVDKNFGENKELITEMEQEDTQAAWLCHKLAVNFL